MGPTHSFASANEPDRMSRFRVFCRSSIRRNLTDKAKGDSGVVRNEVEAIAEGERLGPLGYVITNVAPTSKTRMDAFLAGTLSDPEQPLLG
jgi:hypothetical protein